uniref:Uncharacterized protein n=1 Tax=viral metagenome TaxID=1070528 RepID=A0A6C0JGR2_9ZZZZ
MNNFHISTTVLYTSYANYLKTSTTNILPLTNGKYSELISDLNEAIKTHPTIDIAIYSDAAGSKSVIAKKSILNINYTYEHEKKAGDVVITVDGSITVLYLDGTKFSTNDSNTVKYWYAFDNGTIKELA